MDTLPPSPQTVLLVDDYPAGMLVGTFMIEHLGYAVETATCGHEAIEKVRASTQPFIAILMDVRMHDMDGFEATKAIRALEQHKGFRNIIIALTAQAMSGDRDRCIESGMDDYISKPIHPEVLAQKLAAYATATNAA